MQFALILSLILAILAVAFALQNPDPISVDVGPWVFYGSTALVLMVTFGLGVVTGFLATIPGVIKKRRRIRALERRAVDAGAPPAATAPPPAEPESSPYHRPE